MAVWPPASVTVQIARYVPAVTGAVNVGLSDPPPVIYDGSNVLWGKVTGVSVEDPGRMLQITTTCRRCDLSGRNLVLGAIPEPGTSTHLGFVGEVTQANLQGATLSGTGANYDFYGSDFRDASFNDANLSGAIFFNAVLSNTTFNHAVLTNVRFNSINAQIEGNGNVLQGAKFIHGSDLSGAGFTLAFLDHSTFDDVTVDDTDFNSATLWGTQFTSLRFRIPPRFFGVALGGDPSDVAGSPCTSFANSNLLNADFGGAYWYGYGCVGPLFKGSQVRLSLVQYFLFGRTAIDQIDLSDTQVLVSGADRKALAGANLSGAKLAGADFLGEPLDLTGTKFDGANLAQTNLSLARLAGATFENVDAAGASFTYADLTGDGTRHAASFAGTQTNLRGANFVNADLSGASFEGADLSDAVFTGARGNDTNFSGVIAKHTVFAGAHLYGNGQAFDQATDMEGVDFTDAVLASDPTQSGGFDFTGAALTDAHFDRAICVACNFTNAHLSGASFTDAYLPGVVLANATLTRVDLDRAWLYCGNLANGSCSSLPGSPQRWTWPLSLGSGEAYGPVPFGAPNLTGASLVDVTACPDGKAGSVPPAGCQGHLLPDPSGAPPIPAPCSASADGACSTPTTTLFDASSVGEPVSIVPAAPPTWNTTLSPEGYFVAFDDGTIRLVGEGSSEIVAGKSGTHCPAARDACGDGGPATDALLGAPTGLAVGLDGSLYVSDSALLRVRRIDPSSYVITTVAGGGGEGCDIPCGDGGPATAALLAAASGVAVDPLGVLLIAEGGNGVRRVAADGTITTLVAGAEAGNVRAVAATADGVIYATTSSPDYIIEIDPDSGAVTKVVGTGTSGYNGNTDEFGLLAPGTEVQVNGPQGLSVDLDGNVVFADTGNNLIRAYVPSSGHVIDAVAGVVDNGTPRGGFNGDAHRATKTQLQGPRSVTASRGALRVVADTGNRRIRQVGPGPVSTLGGGNPGEGPSGQGGGGGACTLARSPRASEGLELFAVVAILWLIARRRRHPMN